MNERANYFKIGIFVLVGAGLFIGSLFALGIGSYFVQHDVLETYVTGRVENLSVGALVKLRGVTIGKVTAINFIWKEQPEYQEQYVMVVFEVPKDAGVIAPSANVQAELDKEVALGLRARIQGQGFLGPSIVSLEYVNPKIYPVEPIPWKPRHYYIPSAPSQLAHMFNALEKTMWQVDQVNLTNLADSAQTLLAAANRLAENVNRVNFNSLGTNADSLVAELRDTNRGLQRTLAEAQDTLAAAQGAIKGADLPAVARQAEALETRLSSAAVELRRLLGGVDAGDLNASLANIRGATEDLTALLHSLEQRPSAVLFSKPPKPASSVEQTAEKMKTIQSPKSAAPGFGLCAALALALCGCGSEPAWKSQGFALTVPPEPASSSSRTNIVALRRVTVAPLFQSRSFTYRTAENSYEKDPYAGFFVPPERAFEQPIRAWLRAGGAFGCVVDPESGLTPTLLAEVAVNEVCGDFRKAGAPAGALQIHFMLYEANSDGSGRILLDKMCARQTPMAKAAPAALAAAWDADLREIFAEINAELNHLPLN